MPAISNWILGCHGSASQKRGPPQRILATDSRIICLTHGLTGGTRNLELHRGLATFRRVIAQPHGSLWEPVDVSRFARLVAQPR